MGRSARSRGLLGTIACLFCIGILLSVCSQSRGANAVTRSEKTMVIPTDLKGPSREMDPLYSSKRKVPNGADPIHNRRAGKWNRPPGTA